VCDGYVGNVALKVSESLAEMLFDFLRRELMSSWLNKLAVLFLKSSLKRFKRNLDYSEYGGAPLLGVNGAVIIGHGRSTSKAVKNGIRVAKEEFERSVNAHIIESIKKII
jgi:glycerol-3-phosphate acyltransferase PlsX